MKIKAINKCRAGEEQSPEDRRRRLVAPAPLPPWGRGGRRGAQCPGPQARGSRQARERHPQEDIRFSGPQQAEVFFLSLV